MSIWVYDDIMINKIQVGLVFIYKGFDETKGWCKVKVNFLEWDYYISLVKAIDSGKGNWLETALVRKILLRMLFRETFKLI